MSCKLCVHKPVCDLWRNEEHQDASFFSRTDKDNRGGAKDYGCCICGTTDPNKNYDWANLTGNYNDIMDYAPMCRSCHRKYDYGKLVMPNAKRYDAP